MTGRIQDRPTVSESGGARLVCANCGAVVGRVHMGRGRDVGQHPDHEYNACGCSLTYFGMRWAVVGLNGSAGETGIS